MAVGFAGYYETTTGGRQTSNGQTSLGTLNQPCGLNPGESVVTENGVLKCVVGPPLTVSNDGKADFRNGTVVDLNVNATGAGMIGEGGAGGSNDTIILTNGTRIVFNSRGVVVTVSPYKGEEVFANGTVTKFPSCAYRINADLDLSHGVSGNGTAWYTSSDGIEVVFYPNGTCGERTSSATTATSSIEGARPFS